MKRQYIRVICLALPLVTLVGLGEVQWDHPGEQVAAETFRVLSETTEVVTCPLCGGESDVSDLSVIAPFDGTSLGGVRMFMVYRCAHGHLFTKAD